MEIENGIEIVDLCLYLKEYRTLIIADLHLGYEESLNQKGILVPRVQLKDTYERLEKIFNSISSETVIITGDLKHEFGIINRMELKNINYILDLILKYSKKIIIIKGNHDVSLPYIIKNPNIELLDYYKLGEILICHGDEIIDNEEFRKSKTIIIGHEHPALGLRDKNKYENFKCFLKGKYSDKTLIVLPSFNSLTIGTDVLRNKLLSPFLQQNLRNFSAYVIDKDKIYDFGKLNNF